MFMNEASEGSPLVVLWDIFGTRFGEPGYLLSYIVLAVSALCGDRHDGRQTQTQKESEPPFCVSMRALAERQKYRKELSFG